LPKEFAVLSDQDLMSVQKITEAMTESVKIIVDGGATENTFQVNLVNIARQISGVSMNRVLLEEEDGSSPYPGRTCLTLERGSARNIHYMAAPEGRELAPFLDALAWLGGATPFPSSGNLELLHDLRVPMEILVLMAEACPHCPAVVRSAVAIGAMQPLANVSIIDALSFNDLADRYKVKSTPTTIINQGLTSVGHISLDQLAEQVVRAAKGASLTEVLDSMIKAGRAEEAAEVLCRENQPAAILPIYRAKEFSVRMGALVTMEEALGLSPRVLDPLVEELTSLLSDEEIGLRGDTAELLGKIGNKAAIPALRKALEDPDPDVREAVEEALQLLEDENTSGDSR
jgi:alkyl hydroperoxide reductase subunit AhpF